MGGVYINSKFSCVGCQINLNEAAKVYIGNDCMLSFDISMWTSDGHAIVDLNSKSVINLSKDIHIGDHVWIGYSACLLKGTKISSNSIIGAKSVVCGSFDSKNIIIAGAPSKVVRQNVIWSRHSPESMNDIEINRLLEEVQKY